MTTAAIKVDRKALYAVYSELKSALTNLEAIVAEVGCLHPNATDITTMDGSRMRKLLCPDCGKTIEEEINNEMEF